LKNVSLNDLRKLIKEQIEVTLTNAEVKEFFDVSVKEELQEELQDQKSLENALLSVEELKNDSGLKEKVLTVMQTYISMLGINQ
jgi:hypothetical protein